MTNKDIHYTTLPIVAFNFQNISTNTTTLGVILDTQGFEAIEFVLYSSTITADGTFTPKLEQGDDPSLSDATDVPADFILGALTDAQFTTGQNNLAKAIGCVSKQRYMRLNFVSADITADSGNFGAIAIKAFAHHNPTQGAIPAIA